MILEPTRRGLITGLVSLVAAPAIVRAGSLMPISVLPLDPSLDLWRSIMIRPDGRLFTVQELVERFYEIIRLGEAAARSALEAHHLNCGAQLGLECAHDVSLIG